MARTSINPVKMGLSFRNQAAIVANLHATDRQLEREMKRLVRAAGELCRDYVQALVPIDTQFMHDSVKTLYSKNGRVFECGWDEQDFAAAGMPFYPIYVEFGTSKMPAQPSLYPAYKELQPIFMADVRDAVRAAVERKASRNRPRRGRGTRNRRTR